MTYIYYIRKNNMKDSKEAYRKWCEQYHSTWDSMGEGMKNQYITVTYKYRFINSAWC